MNAARVFDQQGQERDWAWLIGTLGDVRIELAQVDTDRTFAYRLVELRATEGPAVVVVHVADAEGEPLEGIQAVRSWPGAPELSPWSAPASTWEGQGVLGPTSARGEIGFGLDGGDYYPLSSGGASAIWIADEAGPSDLVRGLGMVEQTEHLHLDLVFRLMKGVWTAPRQEPSADQQPPPAPVPPCPEESSGAECSPRLDPPPPPAPGLRDDQWLALISKLDLIIDLLEERVEE